MTGTTGSSGRRGWGLALLVWAVLVVLFFVLGGSAAGYSAVIGGIAGALGGYVAIRLLRRRGFGRRDNA
jgi:F0F1-type ATP synthase assembly protein I